MLYRDLLRKTKFLTLNSLSSYSGITPVMNQFKNFVFLLPHCIDQSKISSVLFVQRTEENTCVCIDALGYYYSTHIVKCSS